MSLWTGLSASQTSKAKWLCTLRYHSIGFDRFFSGYELFRMLWSLKQFVCHSLPQLVKCNDLRSWSPHKLPDLRPPNSPDLNPIDYKIWSIIQQRVQSTKVQDVKYLMQRLIVAWAGVEDSVIQDQFGKKGWNGLSVFTGRRRNITRVIKTSFMFYNSVDMG